MISDMMPEWRGTVTHRYNHAINGFAAYMTEQQALELSEDSRIKFVEEDSIVEALVTQTNPPWGLDRIGQRDLPLNQTYSSTTTGAGVTAYIIDTGIRFTHTQFGGRASFGFDAIGDGRNGNDCNGHGTHVAGTVGGSTFGVAKACVWSRCVSSIAAAPARLPVSLPASISSRRPTRREHQRSRT
jgi:subtilisin family serine protease